MTSEVKKLIEECRAAAKEYGDDLELGWYCISPELLADAANQIEQDQEEIDFLRAWTDKKLAERAEKQAEIDRLTTELEQVKQERGSLNFKLSCLIGDTVYRICGCRGRKYVAERTVVAITICGNNSILILTTAEDWLGKTVFLTREEADRALEAMGK